MIAKFNARVAGPLVEGKRILRAKAFSLVEVLVGVALMAIMGTALYTGFSYGFSEVRILRENLRATQILSEHMEVTRLLNWDELVNLPGYIPTNFTAPFFANTAPTNSTGGGLSYTGSVSVTTLPMAESYSNDLRMILVQLTWKSGNVQRQRQMRTLVSQYGMQKYVY